MRILLDHCVPKRAARLFTGHTVRTARQAKLDGVENGDLLIAASESFEVVVTTDKNIHFQHDLDLLPVTILELNTLFTRFDELAKLSPWIEEALSAASEFKFVSLGADGVIERLAKR